MELALLLLEPKTFGQIAALALSLVSLVSFAEASWLGDPFVLCEHSDW